MKEKRNNKKTGITLVALVITIVIMLILASVTIGAINGGLFEYAGKAKISTEESSKMEGIKESFILAKSKSKTGKITTKDMQEALDKVFEKDYAEAFDDSGRIVVKIDEKYYEVGNSGNISLYKSLKLNDKNVTLTIFGKNKQEYTLTTSIINLNEDIEWESSDTTVATVENGTVKSIKNGMAIITAKCTSNGEEYSDTCSVLVEQYIDTSYIKYDVEYKDVFTGTLYTKNTGWRIMTEIDKDATSYTGDIKIISTGIPARLYWYWRTIKKFENTTPATIGKWAGDATQRQQFITDSGRGATSYSNVYAAAGLIYNFKNIVFNKTGTKSTLESQLEANYGGYIEIRNSGNLIEAGNDTTGETLFQASIASGTISTIRSLKMRDMKNDLTMTRLSSDKKPGLFILGGYTPDPHSWGQCHLPLPDDTTQLYLERIEYNGRFTHADSDSSNKQGIRPVIEILNCTITREEDSPVWKFVKE